MNQKEKIIFIISTLDSLYPNPPIPLLHKDNYTLLIAVLLSARCTDLKVNQVTPHLFELADNPTDMISQDIDTSITVAPILAVISAINKIDV